MALGGNIGNGSRVGYSDTSPLSYVRVAQLLDIPKFISLVASDINTTVHSSSRIMTSMAGMFPVPEIEMLLLSDLDEVTTPSHEHLRVLHTTAAIVYWCIDVPVNIAQTRWKSWEFQAYVKEITDDVTKIEDRQETKASLRYAGGLIRHPASNSPIVS